MDELHTVLHRALDAVLAQPITEHSSRLFLEIVQILLHPRPSAGELEALRAQIDSIKKTLDLHTVFHRND